MDTTGSLLLTTLSHNATSFTTTLTTNSYNDFPPTTTTTLLYNINTTSMQQQQQQQPQQNGCLQHDASLANIIYSLFMAIVMFTSLIGNVLVVLAVLMSPGLRRKITSLFIGSLACSDFLYAALLIPFRISVRLHNSSWCHDLPICYLYILSDSFCNTASILNLLVLAIDRYIAIKYPFCYQEIMTRSRAKKSIVCVYIAAALWSTAGILNWKDSMSPSGYIKRMCLNSNKIYYLVSFLGIYFTSLLIITCVYIRILHIALSHIRAIERNNTESSQRSDSIENSSKASKFMKKSRSKRNKKELKTTKSIALVYGTFVCCWLPSCLIVIVTNLNEDVFPMLRQTNERLFLFVYYAFIEVLPVLNTALNPFIYSFSNKQFRLAFKRVIFKILRRPNNYFDTYWGDSTRQYSEMSRMSHAEKQQQQQQQQKQQQKTSNGNSLKNKNGYSQTSLDAI